MPRLLTLGCLLLPVTALFAADPPAVPSLYPTSQSGSLSQSLPSLVNGSLSTVPTVPPPVMVSQPGWGGLAYGSLGCPTAICPTVTCPTPACATRQPLLVPRVHRLPMPVATGCAARGSILDRLREWLCGGSGPAVTSGCVFAPPVVPLRDWGWKDDTSCGTAGAGGWPSRCDARGGRLLPLGRVFGHAADPCPTTACQPAVGPRPIHIPLASAADCPTTCGSSRPGLLRRLMAFLSQGWFDCEPSCVPTGLAVSGGGYDVPWATAPVAQGNPPSLRQPALGQPVGGLPAVSKQYPAVPAYSTPVVQQTGAVSGYHFAATGPKSVAVVPAGVPTRVPKAPAYPGTSILPVSASQPLTVQR